MTDGVHSENPYYFLSKRQNMPYKNNGIRFIRYLRNREMGMSVKETESRKHFVTKYVYELVKVRLEDSQLDYNPLYHEYNHWGDDEHTFQFGIRMYNPRKKFYYWIQAEAHMTATDRKAKGPIFWFCNPWLNLSPCMTYVLICGSTEKMEYFLYQTVSCAKKFHAPGDRMSAKSLVKDLLRETRKCWEERLLSIHQKNWDITVQFNIIHICRLGIQE